MAVLQRPADMTSEFHAEFLGKLKAALESFSGRAPELRVRDWDFVDEEGVPTVQVFLDKGHDASGRPVAVTLDESMAVHRAWVETSLFDPFADGVAIEIGSAGAVPHCREASDFVVQMGREVLVEFWESENGKRKIGGIIEAVGSEDGVVLVRESGASEPLAVELASVKRAVVDLLKPLSSSKGRKPKAPVAGKRA